MFFRRLILWMFFLLISGILLFRFYICLPNPLFSSTYSTLVLDKDGQLLGARLSEDEQWIFPAIDSIPSKYQICVLEFEDKYFYRHFGVNPFSILRALKQNLAAKKTISGASTISMQTIRLSRNQKRTFFEKIIEAILAVRLEFSYSKEKILEMYAAHVPMGGNLVGIEAASLRYFNHSAYSLSWAEAALLAVLPNSPSQIRIDKNRAKLLQKRNRLLLGLYNKNILSNADYKLAIEEPISSEIHMFPQFAHHLVDKIHKENKGERVFTTIDGSLQQLTENILSANQTELSKKRIDNCCAMVIDISTGKVLAYIGNTNYYSGKNGNKVDIIQSPRSTGSILKPFLYAALLDEGALLPDQLIPDIPININGFIPKNFNIDYDGAVHASKALARSLNIPWVLKLKEYSFPKFYNLLKEFGYSHLSYNADHYGLSLILGGAEASLWDNMRAYFLMTNQLLNNVANDNLNISYLAHDEGSKVEDPIKKFNHHNLPGRGASWHTIQALTEVNRPEELDWKNIPSMKKIAWKTGTSFGFRDAISIGTDGRHLIGVWAGNADGVGQPDLIGVSTAGAIMFELFNILPSCDWFPTPHEDLKEVKICRDSGLLAGNNCPATSVITEQIPCSNSNYIFCSFHQTIYTTADKKFRIHKQQNIQELESYASQWFILPTVWENYYRRKNPDYQILPPLHPSLLRGDELKNMEFIYPQSNNTVKVPKMIGGKKEGIVLELAHRQSKRTVFWFIDEDFIGQTQLIHKISYIPILGKHKITAIDSLGERAELTFEAI